MNHVVWGVCPENLRENVAGTHNTMGREDRCCERCGAPAPEAALLLCDTEQYAQRLVDAAMTEATELAEATTERAPGSLTHLDFTVEGEAILVRKIAEALRATIEAVNAAHRGSAN
jgi:hypothetical protein